MYKQKSYPCRGCIICGASGFIVKSRDRSETRYLYLIFYPLIGANIMSAIINPLRGLNVFWLQLFLQKYNLYEVINPIHSEGMKGKNGYTKQKIYKIIKFMATIA